MNVEVVTSMSAKGLDLYGRKFISTYLEHWDAPLHVYFDGVDPLPDLGDGVTCHALEDDPDWREFVENVPEKALRSSHPNTQALRFCHKVFSVTDRVSEETADWRVWIDSDVEFTRRMDDIALATLLPPWSSVTYLGRIDMPYSECGFVGYRLDEYGAAVLERMRDIYVTGELYTYRDTDWHDSSTFDRACRELVPHVRQHSYSAGMRGYHVWPETVLGKYMVHNKGPKRKVEAYGKTAP